MSLICNGVYQSFGTSKGQHPEVNPGGGFYQDNGGKCVIYSVDTETYGTSANKGVYTTGKYIMNAEKGVAIGVNKSTNKNVWTRWEPDGTFHLQVKPEGGSGGNATVKINPDGSVHVTSER